MCFCLAAAVLFLTAGFIYGTKAENFNHSVTIQSTRNGFEALQLKEMLSDTEAEYTFAAWNEEKNRMLIASVSGRSANADVIAVYGPSRCILPYGEQLQTQEPGCVISIDLAQNLFGSHNVCGQQIVYEDQTLTICGVLDEPKRLLIYEVKEPTEDQRFDRISIWLSEGADRVLVYQNFMSRYGLSARPLRFDHYRDLSWLSELIPGKWSDFSGWKVNITQKKKEIRLLKEAEKSSLEAFCLKWIKRRNICMMIGAACLCAGVVTGFYKFNLLKSVSGLWQVPFSHK